MKTPPFKEEKYFEHPRYPEFLAGFSELDAVEFTSASDEFKQQSFGYWLLAKEMFCAQHNQNHSLVACKNLSATEAEEKQARLDTLADQLGEIHQKCNIDGWGDEGAGYDYEKQVLLLIAAGWTPPEVE